MTTDAQIAVLLVACASAALGQELPVPVLELEKPVYVQDEAIRFWVGVTSTSSIPDHQRTPCVLHWIRPDGTRRTEPVAWPRDGDASRGWKGGWGFGKERPRLGRYSIELQCAEQSSGQQSFEVIPNPYAKSIVAYWQFPVASSRAAVLHIENRTRKLMHIAKPEIAGNEIWIAIKALDTLSVGSSVSVPSPLPATAVPSGASIGCSIELQSFYMFRDGAEYEITIGAVLTISLGEPGESDSQIFPLRIPVSTTTRFRWME